MFKISIMNKIKSSKARINSAIKIAEYHLMEDLPIFEKARDLMNFRAAYDIEKYVNNLSHLSHILINKVMLYGIKDQLQDEELISKISACLDILNQYDEEFDLVKRTKNLNFYECSNEVLEHIYLRLSNLISTL